VKQLLAYLSTRLPQLLYGALERAKELFKKEKKWLLQQEQMQVRQPAMLKLSWEQLRKHLSLVAITAMTGPSGK
jgi:hypothetical protein